MARGPSSERPLRRGPSYDLPLSDSWRAARAGPLSICLSCFIAPALARAACPRRLRSAGGPALIFPFLDFGASRPVCKRAPRAGGRLVILARMVTHAVTSMPKTQNVHAQRCKLTQVKRSLSVVNFKRRIASFAWRASSSAFAQRTRPSCIQHCLPLNAWRASRPTLPCAGIPALRFTQLTCHLRHNTSRHARLRPFHVAYRRSQRSMAGSPLRGLINHGSRSKHKFLQIALPLPLPLLAHLCSLRARSHRR